MTDTAAPDATPAPSWASPETEARVEALLGEMTIDEKIAYVTGEVIWIYGFFARALERLPRFVAAVVLALQELRPADPPLGAQLEIFVAGSAQ